MTVLIHFSETEGKKALRKDLCLTTAGRSLNLFSFFARSVALRNE